MLTPMAIHMTTIKVNPSGGVDTVSTPGPVNDHLADMQAKEFSLVTMTTVLLPEEYNDKRLVYSFVWSD